MNLPLSAGRDPMRAISYADPLRAGRHPFQTFMLALCVASGIPLLFGRSNAGSINELLPSWLAVAWGVSLTVGAAVGLAGSYWRGSYANALTAERVGLILVGTAALIYGSLIFVFAGFTGAVAGCVTFGFGASCLRRSSDIGRVIARAIAHSHGEPQATPETEDQ